jgi:hypothetical protein
MPRITKNAVGTVAMTRKISRSLLALANAIRIPNIPNTKKYNPYRFMMFSIVLFDVLLCRSRFQRDKEVGQVAPPVRDLRKA